MHRTVGGVLVLSIAIGAIATYGVSSCATRVEPTTGPPAPAEPGRLPESVLRPTNGPHGPAADDGVRQASAITQAQPKQPKVRLTIERIHETVADTGAADNRVVWKAPSQDDPGVYLFTRKPTLVLGEDLTDKKLVVTVVPEGAAEAAWDESAKEPPAWVDKKKSADGKTTLEIDFDGAVKQYAGPVKVHVGGEMVVKRIVPINLPKKLAGGKNPIIVSQYKNSPFLDPRDVPGVGTTDAVHLFGSYLHLQGTSGAGAAPELEFVAQRDNDVVIPLTAEPAPGAGWAYQLKVPFTATGVKGFVAVRAKVDTNAHVYGEPIVRFEAKGAIADPLPPPSLTLEPPDMSGKKLEVISPTNSVVKVYRGNTRSVKATVTPPAGAQAILVYADSDTPTKTYDVNGLVPFTIELTPALRNVVRVAAARGGNPPGRFTVAELVLRTDGPRAEGAVAPGFGTGGGTEKITIKFATGSELDKGAAEKTANYRVVHKEGTVVDMAGKAAPAVKAISSAVYDPVAETVTLTVGGIVPGSYEVSVLAYRAAAGDDPGVPGVTDVYGNPATAASGTTPPGTVFQAVLFTQQLDQVPSPVPGVTLTSGPAVTFPEYTRPRYVPEGFNPSDRVETRVTRLYYYRDAHRVAQIVNREVKSYNRAAVDVRRRAADRARDDANTATDERKRLEAQAVAAAVESRAAERRLRELQSQAETARVQGAQARILLNQRRVEGQQAQVALDRAMIEAQSRAEVDTRVAPLRIQVESLRTEIARLEGETTAAAELTKEAERNLANARDAASKSRAARDTAVVKLNEKDLKAGELTQARIKADDANDAYADARNRLNALETQKATLLRVMNENLGNDDASKAKRDNAKTELDNLKKPIEDAEAALKTARKERSEATDAVLQATGRQANELLAARLEAERTAEEYRTAKAELDALVSRQTTARTETIQATRELPIRQAQLQRALAELERAEADARARGLSSAIADPQRQAVAALQTEITTLQGVAAVAERADLQTQSAIDQTRLRVEERRQAEARSAEAWQVQERKELRAYEELFRREVAAAREDPDTYAPGDPNSADPVMQCSISVIGEGLIQIRGPIKGLNVIRTMINSIDAPVGQVRIGVHTVQVNGERGDRMERVVANIQRYIDHSRFLTAQSAQLLRNAVVLVASRKAIEAGAFAPGCTQAERDVRYLYAFFGRDFTDELMALDSEFLKTGNKLLSLHSMDSTSLSAAMFLLALAKNPVRAEILQEFLRMVQHDLPQAEWNYYMAGLSGAKCDACFDKKHYMLSYNAKFQSFIGYFSGEVLGEDTLTPIQREFIRLAQIFKNRMITEIQLQQRVMERAMLEERVGTGQRYQQKLDEARRLEEDAQQVVRDALKTVEDAQLIVTTQLVTLFGEFASVQKAFEGFQVSPLVELFRRVAASPPNDRDKDGWLRTEPIRFLGGQVLRFNVKKIDGELDYMIELHREWQPVLKDRAEAILEVLNEFVFYGPFKPDVELVRGLLRLVLVRTPNSVQVRLSQLESFEKAMGRLVVGANEAIETARRATGQIVAHLQDGNEGSVRRAIEGYELLKADLLSRVNSTGRMGPKATAALRRIDPTFATLLQADLRASTARRKAREARRPLDEKKLLDMLVDEIEDKFIEILEGTRAHTANIDNYIKALSTALDDDFNTQFYYPSFRKVREASRYWDVTLGQIETTTILTNNRQFAKVSPSATMEFDLPKRNIMITEGFRSAKALFDEYGALMNDPSFLALSKLYSGVPVSGQFGTAGGLSPVRNVLPGLPTSSDELVMAQAGPGRKEFGSALEALIPDPAIYKFETGTGFEIRPVLAPDGQAVVFDFNYMYSTDVREPVRADEKHLGRIKRHFIHTAVQLSNYELREVSTYRVALKASRTGRGVPLLQDIPGVGVLFRPLPSAESSLQQNVILAQSTIFPTLFDLMGLRYAPAVADFDPLADRTLEFTTRNRRLDLQQRTSVIGASRVDDALQIPYGERRPDLYHPQITIPYRHPNDYMGPGYRLRDSHLQEGPFNPYDVQRAYPQTQYAPFKSPESSPRPYPGMLTPPPGQPPYGPNGYAVPGGPYTGPVVLPPYAPPTDHYNPHRQGPMLRPEQQPAPAPLPPPNLLPGNQHGTGTTTITPSYPPTRLPDSVPGVPRNGLPPLPPPPGLPPGYAPLRSGTPLPGGSPLPNPNVPYAPTAPSVPIGPPMSGVPYPTTYPTYPALPGGR